MPSVFLIFRDILLLRRGPQDLPHSPPLLAAVAGACVVVQACSGLLRVDAGAALVLVSSLVSVVLILGILNAALAMRGLRNRFVQTGSAMLGSNLVFSVIALPLSLSLGEKPPTPDQATPLQLLLPPVFVILAIWQLLVNANILRHSFDMPFWAGLGVMVGLMLIAGVLLALSSAAMPV